MIRDAVQPLAGAPNQIRCDTGVPSVRIRRLRWLSVVGCLLSSGCGIGALDDFGPLTLFDNFHAIEAGRAYRSAQLDAESLRLVIAQLGVRTIVNLRGQNDDVVWYQRERAAAEEAGVALVDIPMDADELPSREALLLLYDTFVNADYPLLIHCKAGADRAGAAAAIWRMVVRGEPREAVLQELSPLYGHFAPATPAMDELVWMFQPDRAWIENEYPGP